jgi:hypothetical protein
MSDVAYWMDPAAALDQIKPAEEWREAKAKITGGDRHE